MAAMLWRNKKKRRRIQDINVMVKDTKRNLQADSFG